MKYKKSILALICLLLLLAPLSSVNAYVLQGNSFQHPTALRYYIDSSVLNKNYGGYAVTGGNTWNYSPVVQSSRSTSKIQSNVVWRYSNTDRGRTVATAFYYVQKNQPPVDIYFWRGFDGLSHSNKNETAVHEYGHALGLGHEDTKQSVMVSEGFNGTHMPYVDDYNGLEALYRR
ncbi:MULTISPECIES: matrixin family metalloprotease [Sutcliffiella]|uniref:Peptidase M10 metallopeptidase domain-containing protein n=1 Tax=Sutcliffiella cohnii TaxID=33932 RepID=A0A223KP75_9BACI|nr:MULTISPECIES: matrixin family metalloprotease [Sutcliffiella]AST91133.1 hypothetical protein BC6307_07490 [Sutcliffiella cohnii]WBL16934.1 matrixin family metalloprotease [Sutcliffiella sp. NC1]